MINRVALAGRVDGTIHDVNWAQSDGVLRVKYLTFYDPNWDGYNLWVLVLHKKSTHRGFMVLYKWNRKKYESFTLGNDSEVVKEKGEWIATAVLVMDNKIIQLDVRTRMKFKIKYGASSAKPTEEEIEAGFHDDPWAEQAAAPVRLDSPREEPQN